MQDIPATFKREEPNEPYHSPEAQTQWKGVQGLPVSKVTGCCFIGKKEETAEVLF